MIHEFSSYPEWKAPSEDMALLLWPDPNQLLRQIVENHQRLGTEKSAVIAGVPLPELRAAARGELNLDQNRPVLATGHQTELYHPGVWAKLAMIDAAARRIDAQSLFAAIDVDAPKHLQFRWPGFTRPITDDPRLSTAPWCGLLNSPTPGHLQDLKSSLAAAADGWPFASLAPDFLDELSPAPVTTDSANQPALSIALTHAMSRIDADLGLKHRSLVTSPLWMSGPYLTLAYHLLCNACRFAAAYNGALKEYRAAHNIDNPGRPMPDLQISDEACETPFWLDDLKTPVRKRAAVVRKGQECRLTLGKDSFPLRCPGDASSVDELRRFLQSHDARLSPRALTLTMYLRLLVTDQFVHGIGGGRYEQVNDRVIHRFFGIDPPAFSVTTATLYFPTAVGQTRACVPCVVQEGHRLRHAVLGREKMVLVEQIESLPRRSSQRQRVFTEMHTRRTAALKDHPSLRSWERRKEQTLQQSAAEEGLFDREIFYAIQPRERLRALIEQYATRFAG
jgi:hypothetical protein